jgi:lipopolysaccharide/colanic/teichoic acid biosynthesis glycosyltransferase
MSTLSSSSRPPSNSATLDNAAIAQDEVVFQTSPRWRADWLMAEGSLRHLVKRAVDVTGAFTGLLLLWPVMVIIALAIKFTSPGPIMFQQARRGYRGRLFNVLLGQMSLVGPRPLQLRDSDKLLDTNPEAYHQRLQVLPGVTGPWQIGGRSELHYAHMVDLDLDYVQNWSLARDLWIICKTFLVVVRGKGAY